MFSALSDPNLTRINIGSPRIYHRKPEGSVPPPDLHKSEFDTVLIHSNTLDSNDSGLPGTPPQLEESPRSSTILSSPSYMSSGKPSPTKVAPNDKMPSPPAYRTRSSSSTESTSTYTINNHYREGTPGRETDDSEDSDSKGVTYSKYSHTDREDSLVSSLPASTVNYLSKDFHSRLPTSYNKLLPVVPDKKSKKDSAPPPPERKESRFHKSSGSPPLLLPKNTSPSRGFHIPVGSVPPPPRKLLRKPIGEGESSRLEMVRDSSEDRDQPVASYDSESRGRSDTHFFPRELPPQPRDRCMSHSETVIPPQPSKYGRSKSTSDDLDDDSDGGYTHDSLAELKSRKPFFRLDEEIYDETDNEGAMEVMSNLLDYERQKKRSPYCKPAVVDKVLSKVACDNVRGYAYQIQIPAAGDVIYAVPRREAPIPNISKLNRNAPPKPLRQGSCNLAAGFSLSQDDCVTSEA